MKIEIGTACHPGVWPEERGRPDAKRMTEEGIPLVRIGEFTGSHLEPREGVRPFDWLHSTVKIPGGAGLSGTVWRFNRRISASSNTNNHGGI